MDHLILQFYTEGFVHTEQERSNQKVIIGLAVTEYHAEDDQDSHEGHHTWKDRLHGDFLKKGQAEVKDQKIDHNIVFLSSKPLSKPIH